MSSQLVADCCACGGWYIQDESSPAAERLLEQILQGEVLLVVPGLWWYETINLLRSAGLRKRITEEGARKALYFIEEIPVETVNIERLGHSRVLDLALRNGLSAYDATYLALAEARGIPLVTADKHLLSLREKYTWIRSL